MVTPMLSMRLQPELGCFTQIEDLEVYQVEDVFDVHDRIALQVQLFELEKVEQTLDYCYLVFAQVQLCYLGEVFQAFDFGDIIVAYEL